MSFAHIDPVDLMEEIVRLRAEVYRLRGVAWHAAQLFLEVHENPPWAHSDVLMATCIDSVLGMAQNEGEQLP